jgi:predicted flap endonuclease-1-like 5' DNA nuclease
MSSRAQKYKNRKMIPVVIVWIVLVIMAAMLWHYDPNDAILAASVLVVLIIVVLLGWGESVSEIVENIMESVGPQVDEEPDKAEPKAKPMKKKASKPARKPDKHEEKYVPEVVEPKVELSELPIETIEGIGETYGSMLRDAGIDSVQDLLGTRPERVAEICGVGFEVAGKWITMGCFAWIDGISEEDAEDIVFTTGITTVHCKLYKVGHRSLVRPENGTGLLREEPLQMCHIPQRPMSCWFI